MVTAEQVDGGQLPPKVEQCVRHAVPRMQVLPRSALHLELPRAMYAVLLAVQQQYQVRIYKPRRPFIFLAESTWTVPYAQSVSWLDIPRLWGAFRTTIPACVYLVQDRASCACCTLHCVCVQLYGTDVVSVALAAASYTYTGHTCAQPSMINVTRYAVLHATTPAAAGHRSSVV